MAAIKSVPKSADWAIRGPFLAGGIACAGAILSGDESD